MKILAVLAVYLFGFGVVCQESVLETPAAVTPNATVAAVVDLNEPVMDVVLDTVEISVEAPAALAAN